MPTTRDVYMAEIELLIDMAKAHPDVDMRMELAIAAADRLRAVKALDRMNEAMERYTNGKTQTSA